MKIDLRKLNTVYINLDKDKTRNSSMQQVINDFGFINASRISGEYIKGDPIAGCAKSHYNILSTMTKRTIILEDDCSIKNINPFIEIPDDADAIYLGLSLWGYNNDISKPDNFTFKQHEELKHIFKVEGMLATHAILYINKEYMKFCEKIADYSAKNSVHVDQGFARIQRYFNVYALAQPVFYQENNKAATDIELRKLGIKRNPRG